MSVLARVSMQTRHLRTVRAVLPSSTLNRHGWKWVEDNTCGSSSVANSMEESMEMLDRFNVNGEVIATRINVVLIHRLCIFDHEMCIENRAISEVLSKLFDDGGAEGQVWNEVPIHDVEMKPIKTCFNGFIACRTKGCKVGG